MIKKKISGGILASRIIDFTYLTKLYNYELDTKEKIELFLQKLQKLFLNKLKQLSSKDMGTKLYNKFLDNGIDSFLKSHIVYDKNDKINVEDWYHFNFTPHSAKPRIKQYKQKCSSCKTTNIIDSNSLDNNVIAQLCEIALDSLCGTEKVDMFLIVGRYVDYDEIIKLYRKYKGHIYLVGFKEDAPRNGYVNFICLGEQVNAHVEDGEETTNRLSFSFESQANLQPANDSTHRSDSEDEMKDKDKLVDYKEQDNVDLSIKPTNDKEISEPQDLIKEIRNEGHTVGEVTIGKRIEITEDLDLPSEAKIIRSCCLCDENVEGEKEYNYILSCEHWTHTWCVVQYVGKKYVYYACTECNKPIHPSDRNKCLSIENEL